MAEVERAGDNGARDSGRWRADLSMIDGNRATADEGGGIGRRREPARTATGACTHGDGSLHARRRGHARGGGSLHARQLEHTRGGGSLNGGRLRELARWRREHAPWRRGARPAAGEILICHY
jgi:hypothetical protein